jgi:hypothetical protein
MGLSELKLVSEKSKLAGLRAYNNYASHDDVRDAAKGIIQYMPFLRINLAKFAITTSKLLL